MRNPLTMFTLDSYVPNSFEYAVRPCRTLCCGKIFCTEHLADVRIPILSEVLRQLFIHHTSGYMVLMLKDDVPTARMLVR